MLIAAQCSATHNRNILKWARAQNPPAEWDEEVANMAADAEDALGHEQHIEMLTWMFTEANPPCPWSDDLCRRAAERLNLGVLKFIAEHGGPLDVETCWDAAQLTNDEEDDDAKAEAIMVWLRQRDPASCKIDKKTCIEAAQYGRMRLLKFAQQHNPRFGASASVYWLKAIECYGGDKLLEWLREQYPDACSWNARTCALAARGGNEDALKWLRSPEREGGPCPWDRTTCAGAAGEYGDLELLQWCREQGCPWDERTTAWETSTVSARKSVSLRI